jgi:hypothetical protein
VRGRGAPRFAGQEDEQSEHRPGARLDGDDRGDPLRHAAQQEEREHPAHAGLPCHIGRVGEKQREWNQEQGQVVVVEVWAQQSGSENDAGEAERQIAGLASRVQERAECGHGRDGEAGPEAEHRRARPRPQGQAHLAEHRVRAAQQVGLHLRGRVRDGARPVEGQGRVDGE